MSIIVYDNASRLIVTKLDPHFAYQGFRYRDSGKNSGEFFREKYLIPWLKNLEGKGIIDFQNTVIYMRTFLSEAFEGAIEQGYRSKLKKVEFLNIEEPYKSYILSIID